MRESTSVPERDPVVLAAVVVGVGVVCALHVGKLPVAIPVLQASLGLSLLQAGFLLSLVQLAGMTLGLVVGLMADHLGPRRVMLAGLGLLAMGSALGGLSTGVHGLLATRVLEGLGFLLAVLPAPGLLRQRVHNPKTLARALGWWGAYMPLGTATALLCGAPLLELIGWRPVWLLLALLTFLAAIGLATQVSYDPTHARGTGSVVGTKALKPWTRVRLTLVAPGPWLVALAFFLYSGQWLAVVGFLPSIYTQAGLLGATLGLLTAVAAAVNMVGNMASGRLLQKGIHPSVLLAMGFLAMGAGAFLAFAEFTQSWPWLRYAGVLLFSACGGLVPGTLFSLAVRLAPHERNVSTTVGWMQQGSAAGQFAGPPLVAWLASQVGGWQWTWLATGLCCVLGGLLSLLIARTLSQQSVAS